MRIAAVLVGMMLMVFPAQGQQIRLDAMSRTLVGIERIALWMAYAKKCAYCGDAVQLRDLEIDHIIPEALGNRADEFNRLRAEIGLPHDFSINSIRNFLPSHGMCNARKKDRVFDPSRIRYFLEIAEGKIDVVNRLIPDLELQASREVLLGAVRSAIESGNLDFAGLIDAAKNAKGIPLTTPIVFENGEWDSRSSAEEIDRLLDIPLGPYEVQFINGAGSSLVLRTCREFRAAVAARYYPADNAALKMSSWIMRANAVLDAASHAQLAVVSYIRSPYIGLADLGLLPASLLPYLSNEDELEVIGYGNASLQDLLKSGKIRVDSVSSHHLDVSFNHLEMRLRELLRADLDGDGIEEVLVQRNIYATHGTFASYGIGMFRRREPGARLDYESWGGNDSWASAQRDTLLARILR